MSRYTGLDQSNFYGYHICWTNRSRMHHCNAAEIFETRSLTSLVFWLKRVLFSTGYDRNDTHDKLWKWPVSSYTISRLVNFVHRWTNLELKYASPTDLADIYFNLFPKDKVPVWLVSQINWSLFLKLFNFFGLLLDEWRRGSASSVPALWVHCIGDTLLKGGYS